MAHFRKFLAPWASYVIDRELCAVIEKRLLSPDKVTSIRNADVEVRPSVFGFFFGVGTVRVRNPNGQRIDFAGVIHRRGFAEKVTEVANWQRSQDAEQESRKLGDRLLAVGFFSEEVRDLIIVCAAEWHQTDIWTKNMGRQETDRQFCRKEEPIAAFMTYDCTGFITKEYYHHLIAPAAGLLLDKQSFYRDSPVFVIHLFEDEITIREPKTVFGPIIKMVENQLPQQINQGDKSLRYLDAYLDRLNDSDYASHGRSEFGAQLRSLEDDQKRINMILKRFSQEASESFLYLNASKDLNPDGSFNYKGQTIPLL